MVTEKSFPNRQHSALFYQVSCGLYPFFLAALGRASKLPWPATTIAGIYMGLMCAAVWILPLFPAQPKLAPIYNPVKHMVPRCSRCCWSFRRSRIDLLARWVGRGRGWKRDLLSRVPGHGVHRAVHADAVAFSKHLISPEAENWFFDGSEFFTFAEDASEWWHKFWRLDFDPLTAKALLVAWALAVAASAAGLAVGNWMSKVKR